MLKTGFFKSKWLYFSLMALLLGLDQYSKHYALHFAELNKSFLFFSLDFIKNYHLIFGLKLGADTMFVTALYTGVFCLLCFYYVVFLIFTPNTLGYLKWGLSFLWIGFTGNMLSKIVNGYTVDFIGLSLFSKSTVFFNLADAFQTLGWILIFAQILMSRKNIFQNSEKRKSLIIHKKEQYWFITYGVLAVLCVACFFILLSYQFINFYESEQFVNIYKAKSFFLKYSFLVLLLLLTFIVLFFLYLSNKIYGPLYAFERYIHQLLKGEKVKDLSLRKNDRFKHLEDLAKKIKNKLNP